MSQSKLALVILNHQSKCREAFDSNVYLANMFILSATGVWSVVAIRARGVSRDLGHVVETTILSGGGGGGMLP